MGVKEFYNRHKAILNNIGIALITASVTLGGEYIHYKYFQLTDCQSCIECPIIKNRESELSKKYRQLANLKLIYRTEEEGDKYKRDSLDGLLVEIGIQLREIDTITTRFNMN